MAKKLGGSRSKFKALFVVGLFGLVAGFVAVTAGDLRRYIRMRTL